ncbi:SMR domain protein [Pseudoxanthomonas broegbernensis]|uniref:SMR domain protein n=1 Tax=Pseudoxanthomonas broegbernensis TaxID=83619 RepID=A0A7V8K6Y7_9GAMM|nr:Smr/MutS family protein [Pseudoxanthomonas broegbernensis]KAF1686486.1 SMR domain protein [Pseudoxanthomonas broegbernensis]MBB6064255.1 DNA-nicking Smr family endonuclease [Pseudoxanthomonas broegbernensis]
MHEDDDAELFRAAVGKVAPLRKPAPAPPAPPRPRAAARPGKPDEKGVRGRLADHPDAVLLRGDPSAFRRERVSGHDWQRLRRGQFSAQDELDLHGANALQAETLLARFLAESAQAGLGCVRIIHGKGGGEGVPVLKNLVDRLLRQRGDVLAFHSAPPAQGGTGALLVLLARR